MISRRYLFTALLMGAMATSLVSCNSGSSTNATSPIDMSPPQAPANLHSVTEASINRDWLLWDPSASASVSGYQIFSSPSASASGTLIATVDASATDYLLPLVGVDVTEYYRVRAIGSNNVPSSFTQTVTVDRLAWDGPPSPPIPPRPTDPNDF